MKKIFLYTILSLMLYHGKAQVRSEINFNLDWKFLLRNDSLAYGAGYNDGSWMKLDLPHDWSIGLPFSKEAAATNLGGSLPGGIGWYRKTFALSKKIQDKKILISFDGVHRNSEVWINGHYLGKRPYGYVAFAYDMSPYLKFGQVQNILAVKVDNSLQPNSRWYTGSGIYRDVKLVVTNPVAFARHGIFVSTTAINAQEESVNIHTEIESYGNIQTSMSVKHEIFDAQGKLVSTSTTAGVAPNVVDVVSKQEHKLSLKNPERWSVDRPYLYRLRTLLYVQGKVVDEVSTNFGVRSFYFDSAKGFFLNNKYLKIKGVCMHHDLGALGAAYNSRAAERQLEILKEMGCNAIRFSHNPPAADLLDLCDRMGFLVVDEAFDQWNKQKTKFDYSKDFKEWHKADLESMVLRDRNHPSVILWSIGNEIREQFDSTGSQIVATLTAIVKKLDSTRPVISALTETFPEKNYITKPASLDVLGFNYKDFDYEHLPTRFPGDKFIATETASALGTRGVYQFPSDSNRIWPPDFVAQKNFKAGNADLTASAFDNSYAYWGNTHERSWAAVKKYDFMAGAFVWSGFDYLGEPTPYPWPARSSYFGIVDLAGFPKDVYYMYQSEWSTKTVLHIFPHWNWAAGQTVDVWGYYNNADEVELFVNGRSLGVKKKDSSQLHVMWRVSFEPGSLKAVSRLHGKEVMTKEIKTAGAAARLELTADRDTFNADGKDLSFVTVRVVDKDGNLVPDASLPVSFLVSGSASISGTDNGYQADTTSLTSTIRNTWKGMALAIVRSGRKKGNSTLTASSPGLPVASIRLKMRD